MCLESKALILCVLTRSPGAQAGGRPMCSVLSSRNEIRHCDAGSEELFFLNPSRKTSIPVNGP
jgi:hypothetical protein